MSAEEQPLGVGWVAGQLVLIAALAAAAAVGPRWPSNPVTLPLGVAFALAGLLLFAAGLVGLGSSLTPFPRPRGPLVDTGAFGLVRHPLYGGVLLGVVGLALLTRPLVLAVAPLGLIFLTLKSRHEERLLLERFPEYADYCRRVRRRFIPYVV
jgi:protein-S-isoprenylcysteine O-methyltransferase Ste14